jgi:enoyl-CoA hydratase/carnithine racemase
MVIRLERPERRNALTVEVLDELAAALDTAAGDLAVAVAILEAAPPAFSTGMDLRSVAIDDAATAERFAAALASVYRKLLRLPRPLLCAVEGPVAGGGCGITAAADLVWVGPEASFVLPETRLGLVPALVSVVLRRRIAPLVLSGLALSGRTLNADDAVRVGLADFAAPAPLGATVQEYAERLRRDHSPRALARTKEFLARGACEGLEQEIDAARREFCMAAASADAHRGIAAFRERRSITWNAPPASRSEGGA